MTTPEPPQFAKQLFDAARVERPRVDLHAQIRAAARDSTSARGAKKVPFEFTWLLVALCGAGIAAAWFLDTGALLRPTRISLRPDLAVSHVPPQPAQSPPRSSAAPRLSELAQPAPFQTQALPTPAPRNRDAAVPVPASSPPNGSKVVPLTLPQELSLLGEVRRALHDKDHERALGVLDRYRSAGTESGAPGQLQAEALILRMEALSQAGQDQQAEGLAREFVRNNPTSPLIDTAQRFFGKTPNPTSTPLEEEQ